MRRWIAGGAALLLLTACAGEPVAVDLSTVSDTEGRFAGHRTGVRKTREVAMLGDRDDHARAERVRCSRSARGT